MIGKASPPTTQAKAARDARLAEELRANLARRKAQARERAEGAAAETKSGNDNKRQDN